MIHSYMVTQPPSEPPPGEDPWAGARDAARADVQAVFAPRERACPTCGHVQTGPGRRCPACGNELVLRRGRPRATRVLLVALLVLAPLGAVAAVVVPPLRESSREEARATAARQARLEAAERTRLRTEMRPRSAQGPRRRAGEPPLAHRARLVTAGEAVITADARRRAQAGEVDGPIRGTTCSPYPDSFARRALEADPRAERGRYECIAYERRIDLPELQGRARTGVYGTPYWIVLDYGSARMTFCKIVPRPGEGGKPLASVAVPPACRDPLRRD